jgi:hypothetical protein
MTAPLTALLGIGEGQARVDGSDPSGTLLARPAGGASLPTVTARRVGGTRYPPLGAGFDPVVILGRDVQDWAICPRVPAHWVRGRQARSAAQQSFSLGDDLGHEVSGRLDGVMRSVRRVRDEPADPDLRGHRYRCRLGTPRSVR